MKKLQFILLFSVIMVSCNVHPFIIDTPNSGRTTLVTVHPTNRQIAYLISGAGLLYKTENEGVEWKRQNISFRAVDIKFDPNNFDNLIATSFPVGNRLGGIYVSRDGGKNWNKSALSINVSEGFGIAFYSSRVFIGTNQGIIISDDLINWVLIQPFSNGDQNIIALIDRGNGKISAAGNQGALYSDDNGLSWNLTQGNIGESVNDGHYQPVNVNRFAFIPNSEIVFLTTQLGKLYLSIDGGKRFTNLNISFSLTSRNRTSFIKLVTIATNPLKYDLYLGNGIDLYKTQVEISLEVFPTIIGWNRVNIDHTDPWDIGFWGNIPLYILTDGGVHKTADRGQTWKMIGGKTGLNTMEIYTVAIQKITRVNPHIDIYIGTQDNSYWTSNNGGVSWQPFCNEGPLIGLTLNELNDNQSKIIINCIGNNYIITDAHLGNWRYFANEDSVLSHPIFLKKDNRNGNNMYFQNTKLFTIPNTFMLTSDYGNHYRPFFVLNGDKEVLGNPKIVGTDENKIIYYATRFSNGRIGLSRINVIGTEFPFGFSNEIQLNSNGSIEMFWTEFKQYVNFAVNPNNVNHIIVADNINNAIKVTLDGGLSWQTQDQLTQLITINGELQFSNNVREIAFNPYNSDQIFVGTTQSGIIYSSNNGRDWCRIDNTLNIPNIETFAFGYGDEILFGTFGAGLYRTKPPRSSAPIRILPIRQINPKINDTIPKFFAWGNYLPMFFNNVNEVVDCDTCTFVKVIDGNIIDIKVESDTLQSIVLDNGKILAYNNQGYEAISNIKISYEKSVNKSVIETYKQKGENVKGIIVSKNRILGLAISPKELKIKERSTIKLPFVTVLSSPKNAHLIGDEIEVYATNFLPNTKVDILINENYYGMEVTNNKGIAKFNIKNIQIRGSFQIKVSQEMNNRQIQAITSFYRPYAYDKKD